MDFYFDRRVSSSARWARRVAIFSLVLLLTAGAGHRYGAVETIPFFWVLVIVAALAVLALLLAAWGFFRLWTRGDQAGRAATRATLVSLLVLALFAFGGYRAYTLPRLTEVTTDTADPPRFETAMGRRPSDANPIGTVTPEHARLQLAAYPAVSGRRYAQPIDRLGEIVAFVLASLGWPVAYHSDPQLSAGEIRIEAVAQSRVFGLVSDVIIRLVDEGESTYVDLRSNSRYGPHDLGDNAEKVLRFIGALDEEVALRNRPVNILD